ncbi:MAG TPA: ABC transporter ATP-binding protein [Thermomicrobiales bacterium]|nr:ABC transporter ATP-binding protein [Thermomicrobiales bacterium]
MSVLRRSLLEFRPFWRAWIPLLVLAAATPAIVLAMPLVEKYLIDDVILEKRYDRLPMALALWGGLWLLSLVLQIAGRAIGTYLGERYTLHMRHLLFTQYQKLSVAFGRREHTGRTASLFINDAPNLSSLFSSVIVGGAGIIITLILAIIVMFSLNWQLAMVAGLLPVLLGGAATIVARPLRPASRNAQEKTAELNEEIHENLSGLREITLFGQSGAQQARLDTTMRQLLRLRMRLVGIEAGLGASQSLVSLAMTMSILGFGGYLVIHDRTTLGTLVAMRSLFGNIFQPASRIASVVSSVQRSLGSADRIFAFMDQTPEVEDRPNATFPSRVAGRIQFESVSFAYDGTQVIHDLSFLAEPGELVALVGPSGAGKSTTAGLIARFYDPCDGRILLDGHDLRDLDLSRLRETIGMVFQDTYLFADTIRANIAFGRIGATEAEVIDAAITANAWEFIERLPDGLESAVGERGVWLSEGQKQRIAIARALLRDPKILILDEPTSALDARSEHLLQSALDNLMAGRTTFVIAHRLATVRRADRILVIDGGRIVEQGSHDDLLARHGLYRELFDLQFRPTDLLPVASDPAPSPVALIGD